MNTPKFLGMSKREYLQEMCNRFGDFKVAYAFKNKEDVIIWSKHHSVLKCWQSDEGLKFLDKVNNRTAFETEVRIDLDPKKGWTKPQIKWNMEKICSELKELDIHNFKVFHSGSRSYHLHCRFNQLALEHNKNELKSFLIDYLGTDLSKASDNTMLTLEWAKNNKTGKLKLPVVGNFNGF